ncbi:MAG TPA: efflux transporter outer membrane subunit [Xanthobacteraceae bacterium]
MSRVFSLKRSHRCALVGVPALTLALSACVTRVPQALSPQSVPKNFVGQAKESNRIWPAQDWWQGFGSAELSDLVATAQRNNRDLAVAAARVMEAHAQTTIQRATLFPQFNLQAQAQRAAVGGVPTATGPTAAQGNSFGLTVGASYEVDVWGLARSNLRSAEEALKSARFAQQSVALTVTANVANAYFSVLALRKRIAIANEEIAAINGILDTIKLKVSTGKSSHLDLAQELAQVELAEAELPVLEEQEREARISLAVLLGELPETFEVRARNPDNVQPPLVTPGLPSDLLARRPDVAQAEANLASAHANLDAARAAFFPQLALTGNGGFASTAVSALLHGPSVAWDIGGTLLQTVFDGGKLIGQKDLAKATQQELVASYQSAVLNAYADVENALGQVTNSSRAETHLVSMIEAAREAFEISQLQYRQGATDFITVLQAQQTLFSGEDQLAQTTLTRMQAVVHLYEALGGGWIEAPDDRTQRTVAQTVGTRP